MPRRPGRPQGPSYLWKVPRAIKVLRDGRRRLDELDARTLAKVLRIATREARALIRRAAGRAGADVVSRGALLAMWEERIGADERLTRTISDNDLGDILGIDNAAAIRLARKLRPATGKWAISPAALRQALNEALVDDLEVLGAGDVAALLEVDRSTGTRILQRAGAPKTGRSLAIAREALMCFLVAEYNAFGGHERFGELHDALDGRGGERIQVAAQALERPHVYLGERVAAAQGEVRIKAATTEEYLATIRLHVHQLRDPATKRELDAVLAGLTS